MSEKNSKGVIFLDEQLESINLLSDELAGKLLKSCLKYNQTGETPTDPQLQFVFSFFKTQIDRNNKKYVEICEKRKQAVNKRYSKDTNEENKSENKQENTNEENKNENLQMNTNKYNPYNKNLNLNLNKNLNKNLNNSESESDNTHAHAREEISQIDFWINDLKSDVAMQKAYGDKLAPMLEKFKIEKFDKVGLTTHEKGYEDLKKYFANWLQKQPTLSTNKAAATQKKVAAKKMPESFKKLTGRLLMFFQLTDKVTSLATVYEKFWGYCQEPEQIESLQSYVNPFIDFAKNSNPQPIDEIEKFEQWFNIQDQIQKF